MTAATWTRVAGPPVVYGGLNIQAAKRVGTTQTVGGTDLNAAAGMFIGAQPATGERYCAFLDIVKGSPNFSFTLFSKNTSTTLDVTKATFDAQVVTSSPVITSHISGTTRTLAVSEADGALNAVNIFWDRGAPKIEISDIAIVRFA
jgi:hypothetical protein